MFDKEGRDVGRRDGFAKGQHILQEWRREHLRHLHLQGMNFWELTFCGNNEKVEIK